MAKPAHAGGEMRVLYLMCWRRNYPQATGTRPEALVYHIWPVRWGSRPTPLRLWAVAEGKKRVCRVEDSCQNGGFSIPCFSPNPVFLALCPAHLPSDAHLHLGRLNHT